MVVIVWSLLCVMAASLCHQLAFCLRPNDQHQSLNKRNSALQHQCTVHDKLCVATAFHKRLTRVKHFLLAGSGKYNLMKFMLT